MGQLQGLLRATVALSALGFVLNPAAAGPAACTTSGNVTTCTGDQSGGVASGVGNDFQSPPTDTLNVNNLTQAIMPGAGVDGISFTNNDALGITINADTSGFGITTNGSDADGIDVFNSGGGDVMITSIGDITTNGTDSLGIKSRIQDDGNNSIISIGNITAQGSNAQGIDASVQNDGNVSITSTGNVSSEDIGIQADVFRNGDITITSMGDISTTGTSGVGIDADVFSDGNIIISSTGNISTMGSNAKGIRGDNEADGTVTILSTGNVSTMSRNATGIEGEVGNGTANITSVGNISTEGRDADGIYGDVGTGNITITSTGTITTKGEFAEGIAAKIERDGNVTISFMGSISTEEDDAEGIDVDVGRFTGSGAGGGDVVVTSMGNISTTEDDAEGINVRIAGAGNMSITSMGTIAAVKAAGIQADMDGTGTINITTSGSVSGTTGIQILVRDANAPATVSTSAAVTGTGGTAINFQGNGNDTLNILPGSVINGSIDFGNGNDNMGGTNAADIDTLNVANGVNAVLTFADAGGAGQGDAPNLQSAPENLIGNVVRINGGTGAVAVDASNFAASQTFISNLGTSIMNAVGGLFQPGGEAGDEQVAGFSLQGDGTRITPVASIDETGTGTRVWASGFGGVRDQEGTRTVTGLSHLFGGLMFGAEGVQSGGFRAGAFSGWSHSRLKTATNASEVKVNSGFAGLYAQKDWATHWLRAVISGGYAGNESRRFVGNAAAEADFDSFFVAPGVSGGFQFGEYAPERPLWASVRVHYGGLFIDGYRESGSAAPLTVASRDVHVLNTRAQVSAPMTQRGTDGAVFYLEGRAGLDAQFNLGGNQVNTTVAGTPFNFNASFDDEIVSGFAGFTLSRTSADGRSMFKASGEALAASDGSFEARGNMTASWFF